MSAALELRNRYAAVATAQRALGAIRIDAGQPRFDGSLSQVRGLVGRINERIVAGEPAEPSDDTISDFDQMIGDSERAIRAALTGLDFSEIRAAMPPVRDSRPQEVAALLDVCLGSETPERLDPILDYLVTLLATDPSGPGRVLARDPVSITPRLQSMCSSVACDAEEILRAVEALDAQVAAVSQAESLETEAIEPLLEQGRECKVGLGKAAFAPEVLRKLVEYNILVAERFEDDLEADRTLHELEDDRTLYELDIVADPTVEEEPPTKSVAPPEEHIDEEIRAGLRKIASGFRQRVTLEVIEAGIHTEIADALELSILSRPERAVFESWGDGDTDELLRDVIMVGLVLRKRRDLEDRTLELHVPCEILQKRWVPDLNDRIRREMTVKLAHGDLVGARNLSQTRAKFLSRLLDDHWRARAAENKDASRDAALALEIPALLQDSAGKPRAPGRATGPSPRRGRLVRLAIAASIVAAALTGTTQLWIPRNQHSLAMLPANSVRDLSPYLISAYRDGFGQGTRLFGTLNDGWEEMSEAKQHEEAERLGKRLGWTGTDEVMLFDRGHRLRVHFLGGRLLFPPEPSG